MIGSGIGWLRTAAIALTFNALAGCGGQPQISKANIRLVDKLQTAVAAKKKDWLELTSKQIDQQHASGKLTDDEYTALQPIVADAHGRRWNEANEQLTRLIRGQHAK